MNTATYNGWSTYETWLYNVEVDYDEELLNELWKESQDKEFPQEYFRAAIRNDISNNIERIIEDSDAKGFALSLLLASTKEINIYELAEHYADGYPQES